MTISCMADSECTPEAFLNPVKDPSELVIDPKGLVGITHKGAEGPQSATAADSARSSGPQKILRALGSLRSGAKWSATKSAVEWTI